MVYLAYGSNVNPDVMRNRCPDSKFLGRGVILNHTLSFNGDKLNSYLTIEKKQQSTVPVAIYELSNKDVEKLDRYEAYPELYSKGIIRFVSENKEINHGLVYIMNDFEKGLPTIEYLNNVIEGYKRINLDINNLKNAIEESIENINIYDISRKYQIKKRIKKL